jgi:hypothetical protein
MNKSRRLTSFEAFVFRPTPSRAGKARTTYMTTYLNEEVPS